MSNTTAKVSDKVGFLGLWLFSFSAFLSTSGAISGYILSTFAMLFVSNYWRKWLFKPLVLVPLAFGVYITLRTVFAVHDLPEASDEIWDKWIAWLKLCLFIPFGYWVYRRPEWRRGLLLASVLGLVIGMLLKVDWNNLSQILAMRSGFQFPAIGFAYVAGIALLGLGLLGTASREFGSRWIKVFWWFLLGLLFLILLQGFIQSYSRGAWLAMIAALFALPLVWFRNSERNSVTKKQIITTGVLFLVLLSVVGVINQKQIHERLMFESDIFKQIIANKHDSAEISSTTLRLNVWSFGLDKFSERPLFGWGPGTTEYLVKQSGRPDKLQHSQGDWMLHLHNAYIEMLVQFGLLGLAFGVLILVLMGQAVIKTFQAGLMPRRYVLFFLCVFVFAAIWSIFDYRTVHRDWRFSWILIAGTLFSFYLQMILKKNEESEVRVVSE